MIKFFRKIRYDLLGKNKTGKYLKYAIGEIILVVVGILIALSINNWNEERKNRIHETSMLKQLKNEFSSNLNQLEDKIALRKNIIHSSHRLLKYIDENNQVEKDSVEFHIHRTIFVPTFNSILNDLVTSSQLNLIKNDTLKILLSHWPSEVEQLIEEENVWVEYRNDQYLPFLTTHYQSRNIFHSIHRDMEIQETALMDGVISSNEVIGSSQSKSDPTSLFKNSEFENHLGFALLMNEISNSQSYTLKNRILIISSIINDELNGK